ncbi:hypothetical protein EZS27_005746 [termite gut metagenome]|uniref:Uncharacterized protein n=1 Tax=termite gut metagenome TaxID=433724 RepID=A0A5J4SNJ8_9ZZZZ
MNLLNFSKYDPGEVSSTSKFKEHREDLRVGSSSTNTNFWKLNG